MAERLQQQLDAAARRRGLAPPRVWGEPRVGATSRVFIGPDFVIKVPLDRDDAVHAVRTDAAVTRFVHGHGVQAAELLAMDESREVLDVPYSVLRRPPTSVSVAELGGAADSVWEAVGRQLALVHTLTPSTAPPVRRFRQSPEVDPRPWVDELRAGGALSRADADWLDDLLTALADSALGEETIALCHGDVNAGNVLVEPGSGRFSALIDWAGAGWLDPVWDFVGVPLQVVPPLLAGHRSLAPLPADHCAEERLLWCQAQTRLHTARALPRATERAERLAHDVRQLRSFAAVAGVG